MGKPCIIKERFEKKYRLPELDKKLTKTRMLNESRNIARCSKIGINVPTIYFVDMLNRKIYMQAIPNSVQLKEILKHINSKDYNIALTLDGNRYDSLKFANHIDSLAAAGAVLADVWVDGVSMPVVDSLGDEFLDYVKDGMKITIKPNGVVEVE